MYGILKYERTPTEQRDDNCKKELVNNWSWGYASYNAPGIGYAVANFIGL
jgi:hypothetical protein